MTVHCVEFMAASDVNIENVRNKVANLASKYGQKLPKQNAPFDEGQTLDGSTSFVKGVYRFELTSGQLDSEKSDLLEQIRKEMDKSASWWQTRWRECDHDEDQKTGCSWEYKNSSGGVPGEVAW